MFVDHPINQYMKNIPFYDNLVDSAGRFPCLPLDHRHTRYRPTKTSFLTFLPDGDDKKSGLYDQIIDRTNQAGSIFGVEPASVAGLQKMIRLAMSGSALSDRSQKFSFQYSHQPETAAAFERNDIDAVTATSGFLIHIHEMLENAATYNYLRWAFGIVKTRAGKEMCIARTKLSLEDVGPENRKMLEHLLNGFER